MLERGVCELSHTFLHHICKAKEHHQSDSQLYFGVLNKCYMYEQICQTKNKTYTDTLL